MKREKEKILSVLNKIAKKCGIKEVKFKLLRKYIGEYDFKKNTIYLSEKLLSNKKELVDTFFHEVLHKFIPSHTIEFEEAEEYLGVKNLSLAQHADYCDNIDFLMGRMKEKFKGDKGFFVHTSKKPKWKWALSNWERFYFSTGEVLKIIRRKLRLSIEKISKISRISERKIREIERSADDYDCLDKESKRLVKLYWQGLWNYYLSRLKILKRKMKYLKKLKKVTEKQLKN